MAINLHATTDFGKGDTGCVAGHAATRVEVTVPGTTLVVALQDIRAGANGWFEKKENPRADAAR